MFMLNYEKFVNHVLQVNKSLLNYGCIENENFKLKTFKAILYYCFYYSYFLFIYYS